MSDKATNIRTIVVLVVTTALILVGLWLLQKPWENSGQDPTDGGTAGGVSTVDVSIAPGQAAPAVGEPAADFTAITTTGETVTLSELRGKPTWVVFGATWCANCRAEAPDVVAVAEEFEGRANVLTVYVGESMSTVQEYAERIKASNPQIIDSTKSVGSAYSVIGIPVHFFIDGEGIIREIVLGTLTKQSASERLEALGA